MATARDEGTTQARIAEIGRSVAGEAAASGRMAITRSFRFHRPRGGFCHAGWCQQCRIATPQGPRLACMLPAGSAALPGGIDLLRPVGWLAERFSPWFHEVVLPEALRQTFVERLRSLSAAPRPSTKPQPARGRRREETCQTLVAGGGLTGLEAAGVLASLGQDVLLCEAGPLGGRAALAHAAVPQVAEAESKAREAGARLLTHTLVAGLYESPRRALAVGADGPIVISFERLVVATGAIDKLPAFAGNDVPGIIGAAAFVRLAAASAIPGYRVIGVIGPGPEVASLRRTAERHGLDFAWQANTIPERATGSRHIRSVDFAGGGRKPCDLLVSCYLQPTYELLLQAGLHADVSGSPPVVRPVGESAVPLFAVGSVAGSIAQRHEISTAAPAWLAGEEGWRSDDGARLLGPPPDPATIICPCEDVRAKDLDRAIADGFDDIELLKRRTGAATGPCQGKLCHAEIAACLARQGKRVALPTQRPFVRPIPLAELADSLP